MLSKLKHFLQTRRENYQLMRRALEAVGREFESMESNELEKLIDNPNAVYEFERDFDSTTIHFVLQEFGAGDKSGWSIDASGLATFCGVAPSYQFFTD